jgi:hypothetical protein
MSGDNSPRVGGSLIPRPERVIASHSQLRRSISANVLSETPVQHPDRPASAITPLASPVHTSEPFAHAPVVSIDRRPRTRHYVEQERALQAAAQNVAGTSGGVGTPTSEQNPPDAEPTATLDEHLEFHLPAASTPPEASEPSNAVTLQTPITPHLYDRVAQTQGLPESPQGASLSLALPAGVSSRSALIDPPSVVELSVPEHAVSLTLPASQSTETTVNAPWLETWLASRSLGNIPSSATLLLH